MRFLFFDIEASEGRSMCSFGYVLCDENFGIIKKEDILINPEARFCTQAVGKKNRDKDRGITLAYPEKEFRKSPNFPKVYNRIRDILEQENQMIIGFSHSNDVRYLCTACRRYKLPYFSYDYFDIQDVYRDFKHVPEQISLERIINELGVGIEGYTLHKSDDDAEISMLVAKAICESTSVDLNGLTEKYARYRGETHDGLIRYHGIDCDRAVLKKAKNACRGIVASFANNYRVAKGAKGPLAGKSICTGARLGKDNWLFTMKLVGCLAEKGAKLIGNIHEADYYVRFYEEEGQKGDRLYHINKNMSGSKIKIIEKEELFEMLGKDANKISGFTNPRIERLRAQTERMIRRSLRDVYGEDAMREGETLANGGTATFE